MKILIGLLIFPLSFAGLFAEEILSLSIGWYAGECEGYCEKEVRIENGKAPITESSWNDSLPTKRYQITIEKGIVRELFATIDLEKFQDLPEKIGCPDCLDQGGYWMAIRNESGEKRIDYSLGMEPDWISAMRRSIEKTIARQAASRNAG